MIGRPFEMLLPLVFGLLVACREELPKPVDIFPEDACANCRMALSQPRFASEIITTKGKVHKFDDVICLEGFRERYPDEIARVTYLVNYESRKWLLYDHAIIIQTGISTPMGSGRIAVSDSLQAAELQRQFPSSQGR